MNTLDRVATVLLLALAGGVGLQAMDEPMSGGSAVPVVPDLAAPQPVPPFVAPDLAEVAVIVERPVFFRSRRPEAVAGEAAGVAEAPPAPRKIDFLVMGTFLSDGRRLAVLRAGTQERGFSVGDEVQGWRITSIDADGICVEAQGEVRTVTLREDMKQGAPAAKSAKKAAGRAAPPFRPRS